jgi:hypothetical protein
MNKTLDSFNLRGNLTGILSAILPTCLLLFSASSFALESSLPNEGACNEWKTQITSWFQQNKVQLTGSEKEAMVLCTQSGPGGSWTGRIASRLSKDRIQEIASKSVDGDCATPGKQGAQRTVASVDDTSKKVAGIKGLLDTPCKIASNDLKLFQSEIMTEPAIKTSEGYVCCGGEVSRKYISCALARMFDLACGMCTPCLGFLSNPSWR